MRTVRLIIYDGPEEWMQAQRGKDLKTPYFITNVRGEAQIRSIEIDPQQIHLSEHPNDLKLTLHIGEHTIYDIK